MELILRIVFSLLSIGGLTIGFVVIIKRLNEIRADLNEIREALLEEDDE